MQYRLKPDYEKFEVVDGPCRGVYVNGVLYAEIPKAHADRFEKVRPTPPVKNGPSGDDAGGPAKPVKRGGKDK